MAERETSIEAAERKRLAQESEETLGPDGRCLSTQEMLEYFNNDQVPGDYESKAMVLPREVIFSEHGEVGGRIIFASDYPSAEVEELVNFTNTGVRPGEPTLGKILREVPKKVDRTIIHAVEKLNGNKSPVLEV